MKCQKNKSCVKQPGNALPNYREKCTGCDKTGKDLVFGYTPDCEPTDILPKPPVGGSGEKSSVFNSIKKLEKRVKKLENDLDFVMKLPIHTQPSRYDW